MNGLGLSVVDTIGLPARRLSALSRHGMAGKAAALRDLGSTRRVATLLATVHQLQLSATDDALDLLDVLMATKLLARAERATAKEKLRSLPRLVKASGNLAAAVQVLFGAPPADEDGQVVSPVEVWGQIEAVISRAELAAAMAAVEELTPAPDSDDDEAWRAELTKRYAVVRPFLSLLGEVVAFDAAPEGRPVWEALRRLPELAGRQKVRDDEIVAEVVTGSWRRLVYAAPDLEPGTIDRRAYTFCVLESLHRALRRRDVFAPASNRWADPRAKLLDGAAWAKAKDSTLASLGLPENPDGHLDELATTLDRSYRAVAERLPANTAVSFDAAGELHLAPLTAVPEPASLVELRRMVTAMLPRVDLPEVLLEAASWTGFLGAFTHVSGSSARLEDLGVSVAAVLVAEACNIGLTPVTKASVAALTRDRLSHVDQNYVRAETIKAANAALIDYQATIPLAQAWGGGLVASADGMRFVVPVQTINAGPNPRYFGTGRGGTWFNMVNDQVAGISGVFVAGTLRDSLVLIDAMRDQDGGVPPQVIMTDTASYSDIVFGLLRLLGRQFAPRLADMPDQKFWRIDPRADYGPLNSLARGRIDLGKVERHWADMTRLAGSLHTGAVRAYDTLRVLRRDSKPTALGEAVATYGRIAKTEHMLAVLDDEAYRRQISNQLSIQESRHALARRIFHGQRGELRQRYREGQEDQIAALGLVLNAVTLFTTRYMNAALDQLRAQSHPILEEALVRLSPLTRKHLNVLGRYSFSCPSCPENYARSEIPTAPTPKMRTTRRDRRAAGPLTLTHCSNPPHARTPGHATRVEKIHDVADALTLFLQALMRDALAEVVQEPDGQYRLSRVTVAEIFVEAQSGAQNLL